MKPKQVERLIHKRVVKVTQSAVVQIEKTATQIKDGAVDLSSGTVSTKQLAAMGHPFAVRHGGKKFRKPGGGFVNPAIINSQTGKFKQDWKQTDVTNTMGSYRAKVYNDNKVAKYMLGTKTMIPRPILQKLIQKIGNKFTVSMQKVIGKING